MGLPEAGLKICVQGLWHLGSVTAACLAKKGFTIAGLDPDGATVANLSNGVPPLFEPGLASAIQDGIGAGTLFFTTNPEEAVRDAQIVWVTFDTPVDDDDRADVEYVKAQIHSLFPYLLDGTVVLVSSQMPVGSIAELERHFAVESGGRKVDFACSPENLRLGKAIEIFENPGRIIVGTRSAQVRALLEPVLSRICGNLFWMSIESAEMTKHALNAFLATCVVFINEVASVCEEVGADAADVERAIRSDPRVGTRTYVTPGAPFAGGTLARDVTFLNEIAGSHDLAVPMLAGVIGSNAKHRGWALRRLQQLAGPLSGKRIALWGLSYKPGTDATRRSVAIEILRGLLAAGATVNAFDPAVKSLPPEFANVSLAESPQVALKGAEALIVATEWPEFRAVKPDEIFSTLKSPLVLDQSRFLSDNLGTYPRIQYIKVGSGA